MSPRSTIYEVASLAGVSTATVSRVMHGGTGFSEATRKNVLAVAADLGWVPNGSARGLAVRRAGIVGLLFTDLGKDLAQESESPLFVDQVIRGAERAATLAGDAILIAATRSTGHPDMAGSVAGKVDGLVVLAGSVSARELTRLARIVPVVVLAADVSRSALDVVSADNLGGVRELGLHLVTDHGYRDLAFVGGPTRSPDSQQRFAGYQEALADTGLDVADRPDAVADFTESGGARATTALLDAGPRPRALVYANDEMAIGGLQVLESRGLRVPDDIAVTGFDDIASGRHLQTPLTTVRQPMRELGEHAVRMLLDRVAEPDAPRRTVQLPTQLVLRRSCGCRTETPTPIRS